MRKTICGTVRQMSRSPVSVQQLFKVMQSWQSTYFPLHELLYSSNAEAAQLANLPTEAELENLSRLAQFCLDPIRHAWGAPILVSSGFRDPEVNALAGGVSHSDHLCQLGAAADIRPESATEIRVKKLYRMIAESVIPFDQLIFYGTRIHVGFRGEQNRFELRKKGDGHYPFVTKEEVATWPTL